MIFFIMAVFARVVAFFVLNVGVIGDSLEVGLEFTHTLAFGQWADLHVDVTPGLLGLLIGVAHGQEIRLDLGRQNVAEFLMRHLATTELQLNAHLVTFR